MPSRRPRKRIESTTSPYRVFVSHATADKWIAKTICEKLEALEGVVAFRDDRDIAGGDQIPLTLFTEIDRSDELLLLMTPTSVTRPWVLLEVGMAMFRRRIVPVCYNVEVNAIPALAMSRGFNLNELDQYLKELQARAIEAKS